MKPATRSSTAAVRGHSVSTAVRADKFEKPRGKTKIEKDSVGSIELEDEFADAGFFFDHTQLSSRTQLYRIAKKCTENSDCVGDADS